MGNGDKVHYPYGLSRASREEIWKANWNTIAQPRSHPGEQARKLIDLLGSPEVDVFIDLGVGYVESEAWVVREIYPNCLIVGAEASWARYKAIKSYGYPGILIGNVVGEIDGVVKGYVPHENGRADFWLYGGEIDEGAFVEGQVESVTIDQIEQTYGPFEGNVLLWMDIEGSELAALKGASGLLSSGKVVGLSVEVRREPMSPGSCTRDEIVDFLRGFGYRSHPDNDPLVPPTMMEDYIFVRDWP
jgi:FkbM family methyltransferase